MRSARDRTQVLLVACVVELLSLALPATAPLHFASSIANARKHTRGAAKVEAVVEPPAVVAPGPASAGAQSPAAPPSNLPSGSAHGKAPGRPIAAIVDFVLKGTKDADDLPMAPAFAQALAEKVPLADEQFVGGTIETHRELQSCVRGDKNKCTDPDWTRRLSQLLHARWLVLGRVDYIRKSNSFSFELRALDGTGEKPTLERRLSCGGDGLPCPWAEAHARLLELTASLANDILGPPPAAPELPGTPQTSALVPEPHASSPAKEHARPIAVVKWITAAAALGLLTAGAVMLAYDGMGTCPATPDRHCLEYYDTTLEGGLLVGAGALLAAGTTAMFVIDHRASHKKTLTPVIAPRASGASLALSLRY